MINKLRFTLSSLIVAMLLLGVYSNAQLRTETPAQNAAPEDNRELSPASHSGKGKVKARGAFTADFGLPGNMPPNVVAPLIEQDRVHMAARPGMQNKYLPLRFDLATGDLLSGGRYLFDTEHDARAYKDWVENDFILDGVHFFDRPFFKNPDYHAWRVIGAYHFDDIDKRIIVRTERWQVPNQNLTRTLKDKWDEILLEAGARGLTSAWLLYSKEEDLVQLVYFADHISPPDPTTPDFAGLEALENATALGHHFDGEGWTKTFDRTQWILTIWFPFVTGDLGQPSLWPHSPPLPQP